MSATLPPGLSWSHPNFNDPTICEKCEGPLDRDLVCERCDTPCAKCEATDHVTDDHDQEASAILCACGHEVDRHPDGQGCMTVYWVGGCPCAKFEPGSVR